MKLVRSSQPGKTRAETARERRSGAPEPDTTRAPRSAHATKNVVAPVHRAVSAPAPVARTSRSARATAGAGARSLVVPTSRKKVAPVRRQFYYALGSTGAEVRLPSVPMVRFGWRALSAVIVVLLLAGIYLGYNDPRLQVDRPDFTGLKRVKAEDVEQVIDIHNQPIFTIDPARVQQQIENNFAEFSSVEVSVKMPAQVSIDVTERQPALAWKVGEKTYWADKNGVLFPARGALPKGILTIESESVPPVVLTEIPLTSAEVEQATQAAKDNPQKASDLYRKQMDLSFLSAAKALSKYVPAGTSLIYRAKGGLGWKDPGGWNVYVGMDLENISIKMKVYQAVVDKLTADGITPSLISVENMHAPYYRVEQ